MVVFMDVSSIFETLLGQLPGIILLFVFGRGAIIHRNRPNLAHRPNRFVNQLSSVSLIRPILRIHFLGIDLFSFISIRAIAANQLLRTSRIGRVTPEDPSSDSDRHSVLQNLPRPAFN